MGAFPSPPPDRPGPDRIGYALPLPPSPPPMWAPPPPPGWPWGDASARGGVAAIRKALRHYRIVLALGVVAASAVILFLLALGGQGGGLDTLVSGGAGSSFDPRNPSNGSLLLAAGVIEVLGLAVLVITIISWVEWRTGVRTLTARAGEFGPQYQRDVGLAERFYTATVVTWIVNFLVGVAVTLALVAQSVSAAFSSGTNPPTTPRPPTVTLPYGPPVETAVLANLLLSATLGVLLYYCAGRSLTASLRALVREGDRGELESARWWILAGAVGAPLATAAAVYSEFAVVALVVPPALLLYGYARIFSIYERWLGPDDVPDWRPAPPAIG